MHKSYNYQVAEGNQRELSFDLNGEQFQCIDDIDGLTLLDTVTGMREDDPASNVAVVKSFLRIALPGEGDYERFERTVRAPRSGVNAERLVGILTDLLEQYTSFPSSPSSESASG